jgi:tetratricopeptide (TPR) repeat protein
VSKPFPLIALLLAACAGPGPPGGQALAEDSASLLARADRYFDMRQRENAQRLYELAAVAANGQGDPGDYVAAASQLAQVFVLAGQTAQARDWLDSATERVEREDTAAWARWLVARGAVEQAEGRLERALATFEEAYGFALDVGLPVRAVQAAHWASVVAPDERAVRWCRLAIEAGRELGQPALQVALWKQLAWLLEDRGLYSEALAAFRQARAETDPGDGHALLVADWLVGHALRLAGRITDARALMEDVARRAESAYRDARRPNDAEWVAHAQAELAELDVLTGDIERAISRLEIAHERFLEAGARRLALDRLVRNDERLAELRARQLSSAGG